MAFVQVFKKGRNMQGFQKIVISKTWIKFSKDILDNFRTNCVSIFIDEKANKLGFKGTDNVEQGYLLTNKKSGINIMTFFKKRIFLNTGEYSAEQEEDMWVISNCLEKKEEETKENKERKKIKRRHALAENEISFSNTSIMFPVEILKKVLAGKDRLERITLQSRPKYDLVLFKPTLNRIDGRKVIFGYKGSVWLTRKKKKDGYKNGRYKLQVTPDGILVKIDKELIE